MIKYIYIVAHVGYENYDILGVFTDKKLANELANQMNGEKYNWEQAKVSRYKITNKLKYPAGAEFFEVKMDKDGLFIEILKCPISQKSKEIFYIHTDTDPKYYEEVDKIKDGEDWLKKNNELSDQYTFYTGEITFNILTTKGREEAIRLANKRWLAMVKQGKWPEKGGKVKNENID